MRQQLALKQQQKFAFNLRFNAAVQLLQMPAAELKLKLRDELDANPLLEEVDHRQLLETDGELSGDSADSHLYDEYPAGLESGIAEGGDAALKNDYSLDQYSYAIAEQTIQDHLLEQIRNLGLNAKEHSIAKTVLSVIDERGYLDASDEEILNLLPQSTHFSLADVAAVVHIVQQCHPTGVGARNLKECLLLQNQLVDDPIFKVTEALIKNHMELIAEEDYESIGQALDIDMERVHHAVAVIRSFNPIPGNGFGGPVQTVIPDVIVRRSVTGWKVELNEAVLPKLKFANDYYATIKRISNAESNRYINKQYNSATLLLDNLKRRHRTILAVAQEIIARQLAFFEFGEHAMQPLKLRDIATALHMHESTVSRSCANKYMATPRGTFEFKYFFSRSYVNRSGEIESVNSMMYRIRMLIESEDCSAPLSDQKLADLLCGDGFKIARRTVAKYRSEMGFPNRRSRSNRQSITTT